MEIYKYTPKKNIRNAVIFSGIFFAVAAAMLIISAFVTEFRVVYQLTAVVLATVAIQVTTRFILSTYTYVLDGRNFIVIRVNGKKASQVCNITLETAVALCGREPFSETEKKHGKIAMRMNFCQNLFPAEHYIYVFEFNGRRTSITFDSDAAFAAELGRRIKTGAL